MSSCPARCSRCVCGHSRGGRAVSCRGARRVVRFGSNGQSRALVCFNMGDEIPVADLPAAVGEEEDEPPTHVPFPGESPETMDGLRQEVAALRQRTASLEAENADQAAMIAEWRKWYAQTYRPQMEFLDVEVKRLCSLAPVFGSPNMQMSDTQSTGARTKSSTFGTPFRPPMATAPPGLRRSTSETRVRKGGSARQLPPLNATGGAY